MYRSGIRETGVSRHHVGPPCPEIPPNITLLWNHGGSNGVALNTCLQLCEETQASRTAAYAFIPSPRVGTYTRYKTLFFFMCSMQAQYIYIYIGFIYIYIYYLLYMFIYVYIYIYICDIKVGFYLVHDFREHGARRPN